MYFLMIRPQSRRRREQQEMQSRIAAGDEVQTVGGLYATVVDLDDESVTLEASPGVPMRFGRGAIARVITKVPEEEAEAEEYEADEDVVDDDGRDSGSGAKAQG
jgi:preprotein translocase subunit YajC